MSRTARRHLRPQTDQPFGEHVSELLDPALKSMGVRHEVRSAQLHDVFVEVVGSALSSHCSAVSLDRGALLIATTNSALAHQLQLESPQIIAALNERLGAGAVRRLRFGPAERVPAQ